MLKTIKLVKSNPSFTGNIWSKIGQKEGFVIDFKWVRVGEK